MDAKIANRHEEKTDEDVPPKVFFAAEIPTMSSFNPMKKIAMQLAARTDPDLNVSGEGLSLRAIQK